MLALSIRQPYAELILRGIKRIEYRTTNVTKMLGQRFYIYASQKKWPAVSDELLANAKRIWSDDLAVPDPSRGDVPPGWMMEMAGMLIRGELPTGVIVGSAVIEKVTKAEQAATDNSPLTTLYEWHLKDVERAAQLRKPSGHPQPAWFNPF